MWRIFFASLIALLIAPGVRAQDADNIGLSRQYVASRTGVLRLPETARQVRLDGRAVDMMAANYLSQYKRGPNWNRDNPEWKRVATVIANDIHDIVEQIAADQRLHDLTKQVEEVFVSGLATRLSASELRRLIQYYAEPPGQQFRKVQERLSNGLADGLVALQERMMSRQDALPPQSRPDPKELREVLGLFDEAMRIQWAVLDPGPGKDRSGLQALPMMIAAAVEIRSDELLAIWKELPEEDRAAIVAWRESPLAKKERTAIFESAKAIRAVFDPNAEMSRFAEAIARYEEKWRALIQDARQ
jgi:hypothetical protein